MTGLRKCMSQIHLGVRARYYKLKFPELGIIIALILLPLVFWWRLWAFDPAERATIVPGDLTSQYYPLRSFAARELAAGRVPAWDPFMNAGQPGLADIQSGVFYPLNLLPNLVFARLGLPFSLQLLTAQIVLHFSLASLFTYLFVRRVACRNGARTSQARFAGIVAALTFTYSGYLTSFPPQQLTILETAVWLPLILFFLDIAFHTFRPRAQLIFAGVALACAILAGHPQTAMYVYYGSLAYAIFSAWILRGTLGISQLVMLFAPFALGVALAAVQLVPTLAFIARSTRAHIDYDAVSWGFPLIDMMHLFFPNSMGGSPQYVGVLPLILIAAALILRQARHQVAFWIVAAVVALLLSFGRNAFLYDLAYWLLPGFAMVRNQERIIFLFSFAASVLAAFGALALVKPLPRLLLKQLRRFGRALCWAGVGSLTLIPLFIFAQTRPGDPLLSLFRGMSRQHAVFLFFLGGSVALIALRCSGRVRGRWLAALALVLVCLNLFTVNGRFNLTHARGGEPFPETGLIAWLKAQPGTFRIASIGLLPGGAGAGAVHEIEDIIATTPLRLDSFQQFEERVDLWRRWQLLNVRYVLDQGEIGRPWLQQVYEEDRVKVYRVGDSLPRAWVVHSAVTLEDEQTLAVLNAYDFNPTLTALLAPGGEGVALSGRSGSDARVIKAEPGRLELEVSPNGNGLLVVSQAFYPGWRAWVDGKPAPIYRANYLLQAVPISAGARHVELVYQLSLWPATVSLMAVVACFVELVFHKRLLPRPGWTRSSIWMRKVFEEGGADQA